MRKPLLLVLLSLALAISGAAPASAALTPTITAYPSSEPVSAESHPYAISAGPDGQLWFTDPYQGKIGRMTVDGKLTLQVPVPPPIFEYDITAGSDGAMWFVSQNPSSVSRIDESGNEGKIGRITTPPNARTGDISGVQAGRATTAGTLNGHSQATDATIEYGPVGGATKTTPTTHLAASASDQGVSIPSTR